MEHGKLPKCIYLWVSSFCLVYVDFASCLESLKQEHFAKSCMAAKSHMVAHLPYAITLVVFTKED